MPSAVQTTTQSAFAKSPKRKLNQLKALKRAMPVPGAGSLTNMGKAGC